MRRFLALLPVFGTLLLSFPVGVSALDPCYYYATSVFVNNLGQSTPSDSVYAGDWELQPFQFTTDTILSSIDLSLTSNQATTGYTGNVSLDIYSLGGTLAAPTATGSIIASATVNRTDVLWQGIPASPTTFNFNHRSLNTGMYTMVLKDTSATNALTGAKWYKTTYAYPTGYNTAYSYNSGSTWTGTTSNGNGFRINKDTVTLDGTCTIPSSGGGGGGTVDGMTNTFFKQTTHDYGVKAAAALLTTGVCYLIIRQFRWRFRE